MLNGAQLHLALNHLPIVGFVIFVPVVVLACITKRSDYKRLALVAATFLGLLALPAFWTGEPAEEVLERYGDVSKDQIEEHEESAEFALAAALATSGIAALGWLLTRKNEAKLVMATSSTALAVILTTGFMAWVGHEGGRIRHPEISHISKAPSFQGQDVSRADELQGHQHREMREDDEDTR